MADLRPVAAVPIAVGRYAMYAQIGAGGMATVHLGLAPPEPGASDDERSHPSSRGRVVAIKRLRPHFVIEPDVVTSFLDEARLSARVRHPNVVATLDAVTQDGEVFIVMEYVEGVSLSALIRAHAAAPGARGIPAPFATAILGGALRGLHAAHEALNEAGAPLHMVHRDVSPHNILVGVDGVARVLDFGIAKALGRQQTTRDGKIKGKLGYMAPEQLSGRGVTRRTDLFAAGIVLWELLTGEHLFRADDEAATVTRVLMDPVRAPSKVSVEAPVALDSPVLRALERDPSKRFFSAEEMAAALEEAVIPASPAALGEWVKTVAAEELARRARLLHEETETRLSFAASDGSERGERGEGTATLPDRLHPEVRSGVRGRRATGTRAMMAASALVGAGIAAWAVSLHWGPVVAPPPNASPLPVMAGPAQSAADNASPPRVSADSKPEPPRDSPPSLPDRPPTSSAAVGATPEEEIPPAGPLSAHPPTKTSGRHSIAKPALPKGAPSAHERLYSRD